MTNLPPVEILAFTTLTRSEMAAIHRLVNSVWPNAAPFEDQVDARLKGAHQADSPQCSGRQAHVIRHLGRVQAVATTFVREISDRDGRRFPVLALASVCSDPDCRGQGLGQAVVRSAFARVGRDAPVSFFQTDVPDFYARLGCRLVDNPLINSTSDAKPQWAAHLMIFPDGPDWPHGTLDLLGGGW